MDKRERNRRAEWHGGKRGWGSVGVLCLWVLTGCRRAEGPGAGAGAGAPPPPSVTVAAPEEREMVEWKEVTGRTAPVEFVEVRPRVSGHVDEVLFQSGGRVRRNDPLFKLDARWHQAEVERREAEVAQAEARLKNAAREAERAPQLLEKRAISREESDQREARFQEAKAALLLAKAGLTTARLDLEHTVVRSPIEGRVSRAMVTVGNYVSGMPGMATLLTTVVSEDPLHVYADLDEAALVELQASLRSTNGVQRTAEGRVPVRVYVGESSREPVAGFLESLDNRVDPQSGSIVLRAEVPNPGGRWVAGLFARVEVPASARYRALLIPESAIGTDQAQKFVLTLTSTNTVAYRPVKLGPLVDGQRVVRAGLTSGEKIVVNGLAKVRPGMPVNPEAAGAVKDGVGAQ